MALAATAPVQGRYRCRLTASIAGPAAVKELRHDYDTAGDMEPPLSTSNIRCTNHPPMVTSSDE